MPENPQGLMTKRIEDKVKKSARAVQLLLLTIVLVNLTRVIYNCI